MRRTLIRGLIAISAATVLAASLTGCSILNSVTGDVSRDDSGAATDDNGNADAFSIKVGDCLNDINVSGDDVDTVPLVTCDKPHDSEVVKSVIVDHPEFPGDDAMAAEADEVCVAAFEEYIGLSYEESVYSYGYYLPTEGSWSQGDREILCTVSDPAGQINGTLEGAAA